MATSSERATNVATNQSGSRLVTIERVRVALYTLMFITIGLLIYNPFNVHLSTRGALIALALMIVGQIMIDRQNRINAAKNSTAKLDLGSPAPVADERSRHAAPERPADSTKV